MSKGSLFLKIDGIPGPSEDAKHKGAIELAGFSLGANAFNGHATMEQFQCVAVASIAAPKLWKALMEKVPIKQAILTCRAGGLEKLEYCTLTFSDCRVISYGMTGGQAPAHAEPNARRRHRRAAARRSPVPACAGSGCSSGRRSR